MDRRQKFLSSTAISVVLSLACFLLILAISNDFQKSWDLTKDQRHSFSQQTNDFVSGLKEPVKLYAFVNPAGDSSVVEAMLEKYKKLSPRYFSFQIVDLQKNPALGERFQVRSYGQGILERVEAVESDSETSRRERVLAFDEASITNALIKLLRTETKTVYFLQGHGEREPNNKEPREMQQLANSLRTEGYEAKTLTLIESAEVPEDASVLVMAGPTGTLLEKEQRLLDDYLAAQGKLLFLVDISTPKEYAEWLAHYGVVIEDSVIVDQASSQVNQEPVTPIGKQMDPQHPITRKFESLTAFTLARPVTAGAVDFKNHTGVMTVLVKTIESAYLIPLKELLSGGSVEFSSEGQNPGAYPLAVAGLYVSTDTPTPEGENAPPPPSSRIVTISSTDAFANANLGQLSNRDFVLNCINWLAESENQITVRVKDPEVQPISVSRRIENWLYFVFCLLIPFLSTLTGILIAYYRRKGKKL
jgi:gliding motility-associatede transport system auxiliary component